MIQYIAAGVVCSALIIIVFLDNKKDKTEKHLREQLKEKEKQFDELRDELRKESISKQYVQELKNNLQAMEEDVQRANAEKKETELKFATFESKLAKSQKLIDLWKTTLIEKTKGFPTLHKTISDYEKLTDERVARGLEVKFRPALKTAERIRLETSKRREAERKFKITQSIIEYYELIAPFLLDFKDEVIDDTEFEQVNADYTAQEKEDEVTCYVTKEEYRTLSITERNQLALDRFWLRPKSKRMIGKIYERYVGYLYESKGFDVNYHGIIKGYEDLGRDLICKGPDEIVIIQCKYWSHFKTIYEKHIFQFFGTVFQYQDLYPLHNIKAIFYTSTELSDLARRFARELHIELKEDFPLDKNYPSIKCNIGHDGEKIYHLPLDQQYDKVKISLDKDEFYCRTVMEAEEAGFRRAKRYMATASGKPV